MSSALCVSTSSTAMKTPVKLYSAWFCPYAQRSWACLNYFGDYDVEVIESLGSGMETPYTKHPDLLRFNPKGLVPTLIMESNGETQVLCESIDILKQLYSRQYPEEFATFARLYDEAVEWNQSICSPFYRVLMKKDSYGRERGWMDMVNGIKAFSESLRWQDSNAVSFYEFEGKQRDEPSLVDFTVYPFLHRLYIIEHYRGYRLEDAVSSDVSTKVQQYLAKLEALPAVKNTIADRQALVDVYQRYADGSAQSKVGDAVRQGKEAHDV